MAWGMGVWALRATGMCGSLPSFRICFFLRVSDSARSVCVCVCGMRLCARVCMGLYVWGRGGKRRRRGGVSLWAGGRRATLKSEGKAALLSLLSGARPGHRALSKQHSLISRLPHPPRGQWVRVGSGGGARTQTFNQDLCAH